MNSNGDDHRNAQLYTTQRSTGWGEPSPSGHIYITAPASVAAGVRTVGDRILTSKSTVKQMKQSVLEIAADRTRTTAMTQDMLTWKGGILPSSTPEATITAGRRINLSQGWAPLLVAHCRVVNSETTSIQTTKRYPSCICIYMVIHMHTYTYMHTFM